MIVEENNVVTIHYELRDGNSEGELMERMDVNYPFSFLFGSGALLPAFESNLEGLTERDGFEFILKAEDAYGPLDEESIIDVPRFVFRLDGEEPEDLVEEGNFVALTDEDGGVHHGKILTFDEEKVNIDFNHVMAGKDLHFKGAILNIRGASVDELIQKRYIPQGGVRGFEEDEDF
ncbi:MAG: peptidylprolyl isomerase [Saprospiraceae bacterium]|nr:peptidylprolyl isomerase [Saprospiraceae bacterium]